MRSHSDRVVRRTIKILGSASRALYTCRPAGLLYTVISSQNVGDEAGSLSVNE